MLYEDELRHAKEKAIKARVDAEEAERIYQQLKGVDAPCDSVVSLLEQLRIGGVLDTDRKVNVIKAVREATGLGLKEAKEIVDIVM